MEVFWKLCLIAFLGAIPGTLLIGLAYYCLERRRGNDG